MTIEANEPSDADDEPSVSPPWEYNESEDDDLEMSQEGREARLASLRSYSTESDEELIARRERGDGSFGPKDAERLLLIGRSDLL
jgi:hypothetical protein